MSNKVPNKKNILIAEDNDFVRMQVARFLGEDGYGVIEATNGQEGLDKVNDIPDGGISMAIIDVRMEPLDGFEFIRAMQAQSINLPVVLMTGDNNPDLLNEAAKWGVAAVLMKPVERDRLLKTVERIISQANKRALLR